MKAQAALSIVLSIAVVVIIITVVVEVDPGLHTSTTVKQQQGSRWDNETLVPESTSSSISPNGYYEVSFTIPSGDVGTLSGQVNFGSEGAPWFLFDSYNYTRFLDNHSFWVNNVSYVGGSGNLTYPKDGFYITSGGPLYIVFYNGSNSSVIMTVGASVVLHVQNQGKG